MQLIVGLGNIGTRYNQTRHNYGFMLADKLYNDYGAGSWQDKFDAKIAKANIKSHEIIILKPSSFMNLSGIPMMKAMSFYKIKLEDILILHDDIDIDLGRIKYKIGGGSGGHNGLKSIDNTIGNKYRRLRLGIGRSQNENIDCANHVLGKFTDDEMNIVDSVNQKISDLFYLLLQQEINNFLNRFCLNPNPSIKK